VEFQDVLYHVIVRGDQLQKIFRDDQDLPGRNLTLVSPEDLQAG
jgi:hypothetical protein